MSFKSVLATTTFMLMSTSALADTAEIDSLKKAMATGDAFIIESSFNAALTKYPKQADAIKALRAPSEQPETVAAKQAKDVASKKQTADAEATEDNAPDYATLDPRRFVPDFLDGWNGKIEVGGSRESGNTKTETLRTALGMSKEHGKWAHQLGFKTRYASEEDDRINEDYRFNARSDYSLSDDIFTFGEYEFINDNFTGYDYRMTETVGLGYKIIDEKDMKFDVLGSVGFRQSESMAEDADMENEFVAKPGLNFRWDIVPGLRFTQDISSIIGAEATITNASTGLSTRLMRDIFLKLSHEIEHIDNVPEGTKNTDKITSINVVYEF